VSNQPHFDLHQFGGRPTRPVHTEYRGNGEIVSTNIDYADYARMHTVKRKFGAGRRQPAPTWVMNDAKLRAVVVRCVERRAYMGCKSDTEGTDIERLARAKALLERRKQKNIATLDRLVGVHSLLKSKCGDVPATRLMLQKVEGADTQLITNEKYELLLVGITYRYWRLGDQSPEVAAALGIKPPLVRAICLRLRQAAGELGYGPRLVLRRKRKGMSYRYTGRYRIHAPSRTHLIPREDRLPLVIKLHAMGHTTGEICRALGWSNGNGYCMVKRLMIEAGLR
jgi:hypothetical protein